MRRRRLDECFDDPGLTRVAAAFGVGPDAVLGHGGEAWVFALDDARVLRVLHEGGRVDHITRRQELTDELGSRGAPFALPETLDIGEVDGRVFAIERRLAGRSLMDELRDCAGPQRAPLIEAHLDTAAALGDLYLEPRGFFGDLISYDPVTATTWRAYLEARAAASLARATPDFHTLDPAALADALPDATQPVFVHLDAFAANMLTDGTRITAVLDIGETSIAGDRRLDPVAAVIYFATPDITPSATSADIDVAMSWLRAAGLHDMYEPVLRWLAAYWTFALDDPLVMNWCRGVLLT